MKICIEESTYEGTPIEILAQLRALHFDAGTFDGTEGYMIDGVSIVFDDGPYGGVFFRTDKVTAFNPCLECNYTVERSNIDGYIGFCRWTYTFTNADYDAAVARGPMKEQ